MFYLVSIKDTIRIHPSSFGKDIKEEAKEIIRMEYEDIVLKDIGYVITVTDIMDIDLGKLLPKEEGMFSRCTFELLVYRPEMNEVVEGKVVEVVDFGVFVRLGPTDGLCHVSQVTDDFISYNSKGGILEGKDTGRTMMANDLVRARIVAISPASRSKAGKLGLTMRRPFLGKLDWVKEDLAGGPARDKGKKKEGEAAAAEKPAGGKRKGK
ncbi:MAG: DNA-directed RNA polymerase [Candidatus Sigynarchaeota archaeon]